MKCGLSEPPFPLPSDVIYRWPLRVNVFVHISCSDNIGLCYLLQVMKGYFDNESATQATMKGAIQKLRGKKGVGTEEHRRPDLVTLYIDKVSIMRSSCLVSRSECVSDHFSTSWDFLVLV